MATLPTSTSTMANAQTDGVAKFTKLPTELLDKITSLLPRSALHAFALTSKKASASATDTLYKTYLNRTAPAKAPFHLFLRTICERPDLAAKVKYVNIRGWRSEYEVVTGAAWRGLTQDRESDKVERNGPSFTSTEKAIRGSATERFKLFVSAAVKAGLIAKPASLTVPALKSSIVWYTILKEDGDLLRLLGRGVEDAQLVLMLALLPNMEFLHIDGLSPFPLLDWLVRHHFLSRSSTALQKLSFLQIHGSRTNTKDPVVKNSLQFLDIMPSLLKLCLLTLAAGGHTFTLKTLPSTKLKAIVLIECGINVRLFQKIMLGQKLDTFAYRPALAQADKIAGSDIPLSRLLASLTDSKLSLKTLLLFHAGPKLESVSLKVFENLECLEVPYFGVLDIPHAEDEPETIYDRLRGQLPVSLSHIILRYLPFDTRTKTIIEQLAVLKTQNILPNLDKATFNFYNAMGSSNATVFNVGATWGSLPEFEQKVRKDFDKLYKDAGICMVVTLTNE